MTLIRIISCIKTSDKVLEAMEYEYLKRISFKIQVINIFTKNLHKKESMLILNASKASFRIALDAKGELLCSEKFTAKLSNIMQNYNAVSFIIGKAAGHTVELLDKANYLLSLSKMTFPHKIIRLILIEQIYRSWTISNNHPYNK